MDQRRRWLHVVGRRVDWLYRDLEQVRRVIDECRAGRPTCHYQPGHPHGFHNHIYMAEVHACRPLHDPQRALAVLMQLTTPYPAELRAALTRQYLWEAGFALETSRKTAERGDVFHVAGGLFRCVACLVQVLFALNECYWTNEKGSVTVAAYFPLSPPKFEQRVESVLANPGRSGARLKRSIDRLERLERETRELCEG